jgi:cyclase
MSIRIIPRLDVKGTNVIKGIQMDGLRIIGNPIEIASRYYSETADEISFFDVVASLYGRQNLTELISTVAKASFVPLTVTGGIRTLEDARKVISNGADKVGLNTAAITDPELVTRIAKVYGSQATVVSIEARKIAKNKWEAFTESGREPSGVDVASWVRIAKDLGAGELNVTSVDMDGTLKGPDLDLIQELRSCTELPIVFGGGISSLNDVRDLARHGADGIQIGTALHKGLLTISQCKRELATNGFDVREIAGT